jgi:hypothetical protein
MKKWMKEKQQQEGDRAVPIVSSASSTALSVASLDADIKKKGRGAALGGGAKNPADDRDRLLASLESFRRCLISSGVALCPEAAASLEGIMIGDNQYSGIPAGHWTTEDIGRAGFGASSSYPSSSSGAYPYRAGASGASGAGARSGADGDGAAMAHDECAHQLVEMLHLLKKTPATDGVDRGIGGRAIGGTASVSGSAAPSDNSSDGELGDDDSGADEEDEQSPLYAGSGRYGTRKRTAAEMDREQSKSLSSHLQKMQELRSGKKKGLLGILFAILMKIIVTDFCYFSLQHLHRPQPAVTQHRRAQTPRINQRRRRSTARSASWSLRSCASRNSRSSRWNRPRRSSR